MKTNQGPTVETLLRSHDPAGHNPRYDEATSTRIVEGIMARESLAEAAGTAIADQPQRSHKRRWVMAAAGATAVAGLLVVPMVTLNGKPVPGVGQTASAAEVLNQAADKIRFTNPQIRTDQFWKVELKGSSEQTQVIDNDEKSISRSDWVLTTYQTPGLPQTLWYTSRYSNPQHSEGKPGDWASAYTDESKKMVCSAEQLKKMGSWENPNAVFIAGLPRDVNALRKLIAKDIPEDNDVNNEMFVRSISLVGDGQVPADLRASVYQVIATIPGVKIFDDAVTIDGKRGVAIGSAGAKGFRFEIVVDSVTGQYIGARMVPLNEDGSDQTGVTPVTTSITQTVVDEVPAEVQAVTKDVTCQYVDM